MMSQILSQYVSLTAESQGRENVNVCLLNPPKDLGAPAWKRNTEDIIFTDQAVKDPNEKLPLKC